MNPRIAAKVNELVRRPQPGGGLGADDPRFVSNQVDFVYVTDDNGDGTYAATLRRYSVEDDVWEDHGNVLVLTPTGTLKAEVWYKAIRYGDAVYATLPSCTCEEGDVLVDEDTVALDIGTATIVRLTVANGVRIKGIAGGEACRQVLLYNVESSSGYAIIDNDHDDADPENRIYVTTPGVPREWHLHETSHLWLWYDADAAADGGRWRAQTYWTQRGDNPGHMGQVLVTSPDSSLAGTELFAASTIRDNTDGAHFIGHLHLAGSNSVISISSNIATAPALLNYAETVIGSGSTYVWKGMTAPAFTRRWMVCRNATLAPITIVHQSTDVTTEKRFACPSGANYTWLPGKSIQLVYYGSVADGDWNVLVGDSIYDITGIDGGDDG